MFLLLACSSSLGRRRRGGSPQTGSAACLALSLAAGCDAAAPLGTDRQSPHDRADDSAEDTAPPIDCTSSCSDLVSDPGVALCYACRCKEAMDGWLPGPEELQCKNGTEIVVYSASRTGALTPVTSAVSTCANPTLLYGTCAPGGTLGQLEHGTVTVKWICRRNTFNPDAGVDPTLPYDDVGAILYNSRNGASCWFDDIDGTGITDTNWPDIDLTRPTADPEAWSRYFYNTDGSGCVGCHDNDPYTYTPYLQSVGWQTGAYTARPFLTVGYDGVLRPIAGKHLVSPEAAACTACHRITQDATCSAWTPDSVGTSKSAAHQASIIAAAGDPTAALWGLGTWMPPNSTADADAWEASYGAARDTVLACCTQPGVDTPATSDTPACVWEAMSAE